MVFEYRKTIKTLFTLLKTLNVAKFIVEMVAILWQSSL